MKESTEEAFAKDCTERVTACKRVRGRAFSEDRTEKAPVKGAKKDSREKSRKRKRKVPTMARGMMFYGRAYKNIGVTERTGKVPREGRIGEVPTKDCTEKAPEKYCTEKAFATEHTE